MATAQPPAPETPAQQFSIQKIYLRDVSFENPNAPHVYSGTTWEPKMDLGIESSNRKVKEEQYEVVLKVTIEAKIEDKTAYLIEVHQAGIFMARGFDEAGLGPLLGSFCPNILYPYAREAVTSLATNRNRGKRRRPPTPDGCAPRADCRSRCRVMGYGIGDPAGAQRQPNDTLGPRSGRSGATDP